MVSPNGSRKTTKLWETTMLFHKVCTGATSGIEQLTKGGVLEKMFTFQKI